MLIKNFLMVALLARITGAWIWSLDQVPADVVSDGILARLLPGSAGRLGLTCRLFYALARDTLKLKYGSMDGLDVEVLYDLYEAVKQVEDKKEVFAIQRLIEVNFPPILCDRLSVQQRHDFVKAELFTDNFIYYPTGISKYFPEVSRMILKHKNAISSLPTEAIGLYRPELIQTLVPRLTMVAKNELLRCFRKRDPKVCIALYGLTDYPSERYLEFLDTGNFELLEGCVAADGIVCLGLALGMANEVNMPQVLELIENLPVITGITECLMNWIKYPCLLPAVKRILETQRLNEKQRNSLTVAVSRLDNPVDYYESLISPELFVDIKMFLISFDESTKEFTKQMPAKLSLELVFETAMVLRCPISFLRALMSLDEFEPAYHLVYVACNLKIDESIIMELLSHLPDKLLHNDSHMFDFGKLSMTPAVFRRFLSFTDKNDLISHKRLAMKLISLLDRNSSIMGHLQVLQKDLKLFGEDFLSMRQYEKFDDAHGIRQALFKFAFEHGLVFWWDREKLEPVAFNEEAIKFFDGIQTNELLKYITNSRSWSHETIIPLKTFGTSYFYASCSLAKRSGGIDMLTERILNKKGLLHPLLFLINFPEVDESTLPAIVRDHPGELVNIMLQAILSPPLYPALDRLIEIFRAHSQDVWFIDLFRALVLSCVYHNLPVERIFPLRFFNTEGLKNFLQPIYWHGLVSISSYYRTKLGLDDIKPRKMLSD